MSRFTRKPPPPVQLHWERQLRMVVLGASRTGKTQLMSRFMGEDFDDTYMPSVEEYYRKIYAIRGKTYQLDILETAGMSSNSINQNITLLTGDVYLVVYSIDNAASFETAKELALMVEHSVRSVNEEAKHNMTGVRHRNCKRKIAVPIIIAGNKSDLEEERQVNLNEVSNWMEDSRQDFSQTRLSHIEVSAKDLSSVQRLFEMIFSKANLPLEMSPTMHRKVSTNTFLENTSKAQQQHHQEHNASRFFHRKKTLRGSPNGDAPQSKVIHEETTDGAFATVCSNQRRPSASAEMLLVMNKTKHSHHSSKEVFAPFQKLKKSLNRVTSSHI